MKSLVMFLCNCSPYFVSLSGRLTQKHTLKVLLFLVFDFLFTCQTASSLEFVWIP